MGLRDLARSAGLFLGHGSTRSICFANSAVYRFALIRDFLSFQTLLETFVRGQRELRVGGLCVSAPRNAHEIIDVLRLQRDG